MFSFICASIALFVLVLCLVWYAKYLYATWHIKDITGPTPIPLLGNALLFGNSDTFLSVEHEFLQKNDTIFGFLGFDMIVVTKDAEFLEFIMSSQNFIKKSRQYSFFHDWLAEGLLISDGNKWRSRRKLLTPTYHFRILEQFVDTFESNSDIFLKLLENHSGKGAFDIYPFITLCSLDIICESAMGTKVNAQTNQHSDYVRSIKTLCRIIAERIFSVAQNFDCTFRFSDNYQQQKKAVKIIHDYSLGVIAKRRKQLMETIGDVNESEDDDYGIKKREAFLTLLLKTSMASHYLSDGDIREEVDTFMFEGHDTVSTALGFITYCISKHPQVQDRLLKEQIDILHDNYNGKLTYANLQDMKYMEMVIKESLRLYPSVPFFGREVTEDFRYRDSIFRKGTTLQLFIYSLHRDAKYYPAPEQFDPERFAPENQSARHPFSYLAFSAGPRNCIGQKFAMLEMKAVLSKLIRRYELVGVDNFTPEIVGETILKSKNGIKVQLRDRVIA